MNLIYKFSVLIFMCALNCGYADNVIRIHSSGSDNTNKMLSNLPPVTLMVFGLDLIPQVRGDGCKAERLQQKWLITCDSKNNGYVEIYKKSIELDKSIMRYANYHVSVSDGNIEYLTLFRDGENTPFYDSTVEYDKDTLKQLPVTSDGYSVVSSDDNKEIFVRLQYSEIKVSNKISRLINDRIEYPAIVVISEDGVSSRIPNGDTGSTMSPPFRLQELDSKGTVRYQSTIDEECHALNPWFKSEKAFDGKYMVCKFYGYY